MCEFSDEVPEIKGARNCLSPMGVMTEDAAKDCGIIRRVQDAFAARPFQKAPAALKASKLNEGSVLIKAKWVDPKTEKVVEVVEADDGMSCASPFLVSLTSLLGFKCGVT